MVLENVAKYYPSGNPAVFLVVGRRNSNLTVPKLQSISQIFSFRKNSRGHFVSLEPFGLFIPYQNNTLLRLQLDRKCFNILLPAIQNLKGNPFCNRVIVLYRNFKISSNIFDIYIKRV